MVLFSESSMSLIQYFELASVSKNRRSNFLGFSINVKSHLGRVARKSVLGVSGQVMLKSDCSVTETS